MHIPDGFLDVRTVAVTAALSAGGVSVALRRLSIAAGGRRAPMVGLTAAFIFAAQMLNFPVGAGTSGHLLGAVLAAVLVGPWASVIVMASVLVLQCFMFNDGGVLALGANVFNMAIVGPAVGWTVYGLLRKTLGTGLRGTLCAAAFAAWCSVVMASLACAAELAASGAVRARMVFPAMGIVHMVIGLGEAAITALVVAAVARARPELLAAPAERTPIDRAVLVYGAAAAVGMAVLLSPFASSMPDGLERVVGWLGIAPRGEAVIVPSPLPDYAIPGVRSAAVGTAIAGLIGIVLAFALSWGLARALSRKPQEPAGN